MKRRPKKPAKKSKMKKSRKKAVSKKSAKKKTAAKKPLKKKTAEKKQQKKPVEVNIKQVESRIRSIIAKVLEVDKKKITPEARFVEDLGMDSMRALEILAAIETIYKVQIPEESLPKIVDYNEVMKLTKELLSKKK
jgi:acyl carrier protein